jgi:hypothetical protein
MFGVLQMSAPRSSEYIELNRSFRRLLEEAYKDDNQRFELSHMQGSALTWGELLKLRRVVILSEAGSGKTMEIQQATHRLRAEGKQAFFLRLEDVACGMDDAFRVGTYQDFQEWRTSSEEGWLFLDSVDESRLKDPKYFERAIRAVHRQLEQAGARAHIVLTSRANAWRPFSDRRLCEDQLPWPPDATIVSAEKVSSSDLAPEMPASEEEKPQGFQFFTLEDLNRTQIFVFASARGIADPEALLKELTAVGAEALASRPQDLMELIKLWQSEHRIGSRHELMRNSIRSRLREIDQDRAATDALDPERVRQAVRSLAAATTLMRNQEISVPDCERSQHGIAIEAVLPNWKPHENRTLLSRPIFDEEIYGTVRFHHRSTREYLTAEWFSERLKTGAPRRNVESLFFQDSYGEQIVTPVLRPVLPWLALMDAKICHITLEVAPEILLEGGDPCGHSQEVRCKLLEHMCTMIATTSSTRWMDEHGVVATYAETGLSSEVRRQLVVHWQDPVVLEFLLFLVEKGKMADAWAEVEALAKEVSREERVRRSIYSAAIAIGTPRQIEQLRRDFLDASPEIGRELLALLIQNLDAQQTSIDWLFACLEKCTPKEKFSVGSLEPKLLDFVAGIDVAGIPPLIEGLAKLLTRHPLSAIYPFRVSDRHGWLLEFACRAVIGLIESRHFSALAPSALNILGMCWGLTRNYEYRLNRIDKSLHDLVISWPELNWALFWSEAEFTKRQREANGQTLEQWSQVSARGVWGFEPKDFKTVLDEVAKQSMAWRKIIALSLGDFLSLQEGRPKDWQVQLHHLAGLNSETKKFFEELSEQQKTSSQEFEENREQEEKHKCEREAERAEEFLKQAETQEYFRTNLGRLRAEVAASPSQLHKDVLYLFQVCQEKLASNKRFTLANWKSLEPEFGCEVARFFRDSSVGIWRHYKPQIRSEGAPTNSIPFAVFVGMAGIAIEWQEDPAWMGALAPEQVGRACRYALFENNGYPEWFPKMFERFPNVVGAFLLQEIRYELSEESADKGLQHIIQPMISRGEWAWNWLAPHLMAILSTSEPRNQASLDAFLKIVSNSDLSTASIAALSAKKCQIDTDWSERNASWYAAWVGADPSEGMDSFKKTLKGCKEPELQTDFAMHFITRLVPGWRGRNVIVREPLLEPRYIKDLYIQMHDHIRVEGDIDRSTGGVYRPELRDLARDARNSIFGMLEQIPGKDSYQAISEIAHAAHRGQARRWILQRAKAKAEQDGDLPAWTDAQVLEFQQDLERTPTNHKELAEFAKLRLLDLKDDLEDGDNSLAPLLIDALNSSSNEERIRNYLGRELREKAFGRYSIEQEGELADEKRTDLRFIGTGFDSPVPVELKLADNWPGPKCVERLVNQLCGDYLRDRRSNRGIFILVNHVSPRHWKIPGHDALCTFPELVAALQKHWESIKSDYPSIDNIDVLGIDLTARSK